MLEPRLPVVPNLDQLKHQAKDLLRAIRRDDADAIDKFTKLHPHPPVPDAAKLADAQLVVARFYGMPSWTRVVQACRLIAAIWDDDADTVRKLVLDHPNLLVENAGNVNWGPPMSYAANVGRDRIVKMLSELGATDYRHAIDRAVLQGRIATAKMLHEMMGGPKPPPGAFGSPAYTVNVDGTRFLFEIGAQMVDEHGNPDAPVDVVIDSDTRAPERKHAVIEMYVEHGFQLPDTPVMAVHRGRVDMLAKHIDRDPTILERTYSYAELFPIELKCAQPKQGGYDERLARTPVAGGTLLHLCVEFDELEIATWLLDRGMNPDVRAAVDANGFGGHTAMFNAVVSYPHFWMNFTGGWAHSRKPLEPKFAKLLLDRGANPSPRASFRVAIGTDEEPAYRDFHDITPLEWGRVFHDRMVVNAAAMELLRETQNA